MLGRETAWLHVRTMPVPLPHHTPHLPHTRTQFIAGSFAFFVFKQQTTAAYFQDVGDLEGGGEGGGGRGRRLMPGPRCLMPARPRGCGDMKGLMCPWQVENTNFQHTHVF